MRRRAASLLVLVLAGSNSGAAPTQPTPPPQQAFVELVHGEPRADPYRWMESGGAAFEAWARSEADWARQRLDQIAGRDRLKARIAQLDRPSPGYGDLQVRSGRWIFDRMSEPGGARATFVRQGEEGQPERLDLPALLPPAEGPWSEVKYARLLSPNGRFLAFGAARRGEADPAIRIYDLVAKRLLPDVISSPLWADSNGFRPHWLEDSSGFFYVRNPQAGATMDNREKARRGQVFLHRLGQPVDQDVAILGFGLTPGIEESDTLYVEGEPHARWLPILNRKAKGREIWVADLRVEDRPTHAAMRRVYASDELVPGFGVRGNRLYTLDATGAERYRLVAIDLEKTAPPVEILPQQEGVLGHLQVSRDAVYLVETGLARSRLHLLSDRGRRTIDLPEGVVESVSAGPEGEGAWVEMVSWLQPRSGWLVQPGADQVRSLDSPAEPGSNGGGDNVTELHWAVARDGVLIPYTLVRKAAARRDGSGLVLMSGYGCFGTVSTPFYWPALEAWLEQGGLFVQLGIRGGGELGAAWHRAGSDRNKPTSFEDAIDTARHLVVQGWTRPGRIGLTGGSCGGATMGMAALEAPHLIGAAALSAAALDMSRISAATTAGARSVREFGDPETAEGARRIDALSPHRQLLPGAARPPLLIMSGATDYTIPLWVGGKFVAAARAANPSAPVLWRIDRTGGHNVGRDYAAEDADLMAFMLWSLGHPGFQPVEGVEPAN